jgi:MarR family transcriptional regulator, transcriptional regulator for hemolysin
MIYVYDVVVPRPMHDHMPHDHMPLGRSIGRTAKFVRAWGDRELADLGSDVTEWIVLRNIAVAPQPGASQAEIARFSDMGGPALVRHIDRLEADGLVTRTRDSADRRTIRLRLTPAGQTHFDAVRTVMERCDRELRARLADGEAEVMQRALDALFEFCLHELYGGDAEPQPAPTSRARSKR